jgi:hypothetical protein
MSKEKKHEEEECGEGAPLWIISFADMISLLMAFFVLLSTFASFGPAEETKLKQVIDIALAHNGGLFGDGVFGESKNDISGFQQNASKDYGSEKVTPWKNNKGSMDPLKDPHLNKVFTICSEEMFFSTGTSITTKGREFLDAMAAFIVQKKERIAIGESDDKVTPLGLNRSIGVAKYLIDRGVSEDSINIIPQVQSAIEDGTRKFQISILEREIFK